MIKATIAALEEDLPAAAVKLGMMGTDAVVSAVGDFLDGYEGKVVCDPVMVSTRYSTPSYISFVSGRKSMKISTLSISRLR